MTNGYKKISRLWSQKRRKSFFIEASTAIRLRDNSRGLLLQHQQKTRFGARRQGASFFVKQEDIPRFFHLVSKFLQNNSSDFNYWVRRGIENTLPRSIPHLTAELEDIANGLKGLSPEMTREILGINRDLQKKSEEIVSRVTELL